MYYCNLIKSSKQFLSELVLGTNKNYKILKHMIIILTVTFAPIRVSERKAIDSFHFRLIGCLKYMVWKIWKGNKHYCSWTTEATYTNWYPHANRTNIHFSLYNTENTYTCFDYWQMNWTQRRNLEQCTEHSYSLETHNMQQ